MEGKKTDTNVDTQKANINRHSTRELGWLDRALTQQFTGRLCFPL